MELHLDCPFNISTLLGHVCCSFSHLLMKSSFSTQSRIALSAKFQPCWIHLSLKKEKRKEKIFFSCFSVSHFKILFVNNKTDLFNFDLFPLWNISVLFLQIWQTGKLWSIGITCMFLPNIILSSESIVMDKISISYFQSYNLFLLFILILLYTAMLRNFYFSAAFFVVPSFFSSSHTRFI